MVAAIAAWSPPNDATGQLRWKPLLAHLAEQDGMEMRRLGEHLALHEPGRHDRWTWLARRLVQEELIQESNDGAQRLYLRESGRRFLDSPWPLDYAA